jgi:hypothetical protein
VQRRFSEMYVLLHVLQFYHANTYRGLVVEWEYRATLQSILRLWVIAIFARALPTFGTKPKADLFSFCLIK